jgi:hypothetical protein
MEKQYIPDKCKFCGSDNIKVVAVDEQLDADIYAVQCQSCWAEGSHCVTEEMAVRMWGLAPTTVSIEYKSDGFKYYD